MAINTHEAVIRRPTQAPNVTVDRKPDATILVIEDDLNLLPAIRDILELNNYRVITADDGLAGLDLMRLGDRLPDLIVSDIMMPGIDGYALFEAVRREWRDIPFIFLSAKSAKADVRLGKSLGADDYITKPFEPEDLLVAVEAKLHRRQQLDMVRKAKIRAIERRILALLSHEFHTPVTQVVDVADLLKRNLDGLTLGEIKDSFSRLNTGASRLRRLIENFILLVELETGEAQRAFQVRECAFSNFKDLLAQAVAQLYIVAADKGIDLQLVPPDALLPPIRGDCEYLKAAIVCLIENAIKFSDQPGSVVLITARGDEDSVCFSVVDQGRGISEIEMQALFDPFYPIDRETHEDANAGTGLAIVKRIAELHGGRVQAHSVLGQGSEFVICIPSLNR